jgi:hypothetical protein
MLPPQDAQDIVLGPGQVILPKYLLLLGLGPATGKHEIDKSLLVNAFKGLLLDFFL